VTVSGRSGATTSVIFELALVQGNLFTHFPAARCDFQHRDPALQVVEPSLQWHERFVDLARDEPLHLRRETCGL
jgi:hypothetical protein